MKQEIRIIKDQIEKNYFKYFPEIANSIINVRVLKNRSLIKHHDSKARYQCIISVRTKDYDNFEKRIFAKKMPSDLAKKEAENLKRLGNYSLDEMVPHFFDFIENDIILMEYIYTSHELLVEILKTPSFVSKKRKNKTEDLIKKVALWLCEFQEKCYIDKTSLIEYIPMVEKELNTIPYFIAEQKENLLSRIKEESKKINKVPRVISSLGFCPRNILITNKNSFVLIDWPELTETYIYQDLHHFLVNLQNRTRHKIIFSQKHINNFQKIFLETYKTNSSFEFSEKAYQLTRKMYLIYFLYDFYQEYGNKIFTLKKFIFWQYNIKRITDELIHYAGENK